MSNSEKFDIQTSTLIVQ